MTEGRRTVELTMDQSADILADWERPARLIGSASTGRKVLDFERDYERWPRNTGYEFSALAFNADSRRLAAGISKGAHDEEYDIAIWNTETARDELFLFGHTGEITDLEFAPNGSRLASASRDGTVRLWDLKTGLAVLTLDEHSGGVEGLAFSPDGRRLASANQDGTIRLWDARDVERAP
jgi:WD40 repeat protein